MTEEQQATLAGYMADAIHEIALAVEARTLADNLRRILSKLILLAFYYGQRNPPTP